MRTPHNKLNLVGERFNRLLVESFGPAKTYPCGTSHTTFICQCDCGAKVTVLGISLKSGNTKSCGCLAIESLVKRSKRHGMTGSRTYRIWQAMLNRCRNKNLYQFKDWGGRGISVCERWLKYENFLNDMGEAAPGSSIDRIDNDGNYEPKNCRWATVQQQNRNKKSNRNLTFNGKTKCLKDWADDIGIDQTSLSERLEKWDLQRALTQPRSRNG
jgi:hypothetical protein